MPRHYTSRSSAKCEVVYRIPPAEDSYIEALIRSPRNYYFFYSDIKISMELVRFWKSVNFVGFLPLSILLQIHLFWKLCLMTNFCRSISLLKKNFESRLNNKISGTQCTFLSDFKISTKLRKFWYVLINCPISRTF